MIEPYPGIPAGILDEDLEEHVSEKKGPFEAAIQCLTFNDGISGSHRHDSAIHVLEAAGKVDLDEREFVLSLLKDPKWYGDRSKTICNLLEALPDPEGERG